MELTVLVFLPAVAAAVIMLLPQSMEQQAKWVALVGSLATLGVSLYLFAEFETGQDGFQFVVREEWVDVGSLQLQYFLGLDGLSMPLVVLTTCLTLASVLVSFGISTRPRAYFACLMLLSTAVLGVFSALISCSSSVLGARAVPMYLLISIWGPGGRVLGD
jgi:NADH-quinone oxidoreductase subunit M